MNNLSDYEAVETFRRTIARIARRLKEKAESQEQREGKQK